MRIHVLNLEFYKFILYIIFSFLFKKVINRYNFIINYSFNLHFFHVKVNSYFFFNFNIKYFLKIILNNKKINFNFLFSFLRKHKYNLLVIKINNIYSFKKFVKNYNNLININLIKLINNKIFFNLIKLFLKIYNIIYLKFNLYFIFNFKKKNLNLLFLLNENLAWKYSVINFKKCDKIIILKKNIIKVVKKLNKNKLLLKGELKNKINLIKKKYLNIFKLIILKKKFKNNVIILNNNKKYIKKEHYFYLMSDYLNKINLYQSRKWKVKKVLNFLLKRNSYETSNKLNYFKRILNKIINFNNLSFYDQIYKPARTILFINNKKIKKIYFKKVLNKNLIKLNNNFIIKKKLFKTRNLFFLILIEYHKYILKFNLKHNIIHNINNKFLLNFSKIFFHLKYNINYFKYYKLKKSYYILYLTRKNIRNYYFTLTNNKGDVKFSVSSNTFRRKWIPRRIYKNSWFNNFELRKWIIKKLKKLKIFEIDKFCTKVVYRYKLRLFIRQLNISGIKINKLVYLNSKSHASYFAEKKPKIRRI